MYDEWTYYVTSPCDIACQVVYYVLTFMPFAQMD